MASKAPALFTPESARRIAKVVRRVERMPIDLRGKQRRQPIVRTPLPFLAAIVDEGPDGEDNFPLSQSLYYARRIKPIAPIGITDQLLKVEYVGDAFTLQNLAERRRNPAATDESTINIMDNLGTIRSLHIGHICRVWKDADDEGTVHYFTHEMPWQSCICKITGAATGTFAGITGCYDGYAGNTGDSQSAVLPVPSGSTINSAYFLPASGDLGPTECLIVNLRELNNAAALDQEIAFNGLSNVFMLGIFAQWTDETPPRRVVVVDDRSGVPVTLTATQTAGASYTTNERDLINNLKADVAALKASLEDAHLLREP